MAANTTKNGLLAQQARELFTQQAVDGLPELAKFLLERLASLQAQQGSSQEMQERREAWQAFASASAAWVAGTSAAWKKAQLAASTTAVVTQLVLLDSGKFELLGNEVMETQILASRFALRLLDFASWELNDLRLRIRILKVLPSCKKKTFFVRRS